MQGEEFKGHRTAWGLNQTEMGDVLGVHKLTVAAWEQGQREIPHTVALLVAALSSIVGKVQAIQTSKAQGGKARPGGKVK